MPWHTCGAYISGVLGVPTASHLPYCYFNLLSPILDVVYAFIEFKVQTAAPPTEAIEPTALTGRRRPSYGSRGLGRGAA